MATDYSASRRRATRRAPVDAAARDALGNDPLLGVAFPRPCWFNCRGHEEYGHLKLHVVSDLHLEHDPDWRLPETDADVLILAGDVAPGLRGLGAFFKYGKPVLYVPGNHEFYGENLPGLLAAMRLYAKAAQVTVLQQDECVLGRVRFLGATLWTDFAVHGEQRSRALMAYAEKHLNDYITIRNGSGGWLSARESAEMHRRERSWLERKLAEPFDGATVVITHHAPHPDSIHPRHDGHLMSGAFASNLGHLMGRAQLWVHGHTHDSFDYQVSGTRVLANPKGYGAENKHFLADLVIDIPG
jgi:predicted phosphodiesterase